MKKYLITWQTESENKITTFEEAENLKRALKNVSYFEKKTGYEILSIEIVKENEKKSVLLDKG